MAGFLPKSIKPNFLLIVLDDIWPYQWRQWHANTPYDGDNPQNTAKDAAGANLYVNTPWLDSIASSGVTFQNAYGNPVCGADRASLLTGVYTHHHGIGTIPTMGDVVEHLNSTGAPFFRTLLTTRLKDAGYFCGIVGKYHLRAFDDTSASPPWDNDPATLTTSLENQFAHSEAIPGGVGDFDDVRITYHNLNPAPVPRGIADAIWIGDNYNYYKYTNGTVSEVQSAGDTPAAHVSTDFSVTVQADDAIVQIAAGVATGKPWLCYLSFNAPHNPFDQVVDSAGLVNTAAYNLAPNGNAWANYQQQLESIDTELQRVQDSMTASDWSKTVVMFTSDNGFLDTILESATDDASNNIDVGVTGDALLALHKTDAETGQKRFKNSAYEGGIRVPLIISGPGVLGGRSTDALFHVTDLFPTMVTAAGGVVGTIDGVDQGQVLRGAQTEARTTIFSMKYSPNGDQGDWDNIWAAPNNGRRDIGYIETIAGAKWKYVEQLWKSGTDFGLYQLTDGSGNPMDPWELTNLWDDGVNTAIQTQLEVAVAAEVIS
jgi:arylsulfatase A-like enzyme